MRKRITSFFMAILMVFSILTENIIIVEANNADGAIYLKVKKEQNWNEDSDIEISVRDLNGNEVSNLEINKELKTEESDDGSVEDGSDAGGSGEDSSAGDESDAEGSEGDSSAGDGSDADGSVEDYQGVQAALYTAQDNYFSVSITGLQVGETYKVSVISSGCSASENDYTAVRATDNPDYIMVTMMIDPYADFAFVTNFNGWKTNSTISLSVNNTFDKSVRYASTNSSIASVNASTGAIEIESSGDVSFTATLWDENNEDYKTISSGVVKIEKADQTLSFNDIPESVYSGAVVSLEPTSDMDDYSGDIQYSVVDGEEYIELDENFASNGKWKAVKFGDSQDGVSVTIRATVSADNKYNEATNTYTTKIIPYPYDAFQNYCEIIGEKKTLSDGTIWYSSVSKIKAIDGYKIIGSFWGNQKNDEFIINSSNQGLNTVQLMIVKDNGEWIGWIKVTYNFDGENPSISLSKENDAEWTNGDVVINVSESVGVSGLEDIKYCVYDTTDNAITDWNSVENNKIILSSNDDKYINKVLNIKVQAFSKAGKESEIVSQEIKIDTQIPETELTLNRDKSKKNNNFFFNTACINLSTNDYLSGIENIKYIYLTEDITNDNEWDESNIDWNSASTLDLSEEERGTTEKLNKEITIPFLNTKMSITVYARVEDRAGNVSIVSLISNDKFYFDNTSPLVEIVLDSAITGTEDVPYQKIDNIEYYNNDRVAKVTVTDDSFSDADTKINVSVDGASPVNILNDEVSVEGVKVLLSDGKQWFSSGDCYTATIKFEGNHKYEISVESVDKAGNNTFYNEINDSKSNKFYIDKELPKGNIQFSKKDSFAQGDLLGIPMWNIIDEYKVSIFEKNKLFIVGEVSDDNTGASGISKVEYYISTEHNILTTADLENIILWNTVSIDSKGKYKQYINIKNENYNVYLKITDNCGNIKYISTNGAIVDDIQPQIDSVDIVDITGDTLQIIDDQNVDLWNNNNTKIQVSITDNLSGIASVKYDVLKLDDNNTYLRIAENLSAPINESDIGKTSLKAIIDIPKQDNYKYDTSKLKIVITAFDKAGNNSAEYDKYINIDTKAPELSINVNNDNSKVNSAGWYNDNLVFDVVATDETSGIKINEDGKPLIEYIVYATDGHQIESGIISDIVNTNVNEFTQAVTKVEGKITLEKNSIYDSKNLIVEVKTSDTADNNAINKTISVDYDSSAAETNLTVITTPNNNWFSKDVMLLVKSSDETSGINKIEYTIKNGDQILSETQSVKLEDDSDAKNGKKGIITISDNDIYDSGHLVVSTKTYDNAGNVTEKNITIQFDTTDPTAELTVDYSTSNADKWFNNEVGLIVKVSDVTSGISKVSYSVKDSYDEAANILIDDTVLDNLENDIDVVNGKKGIITIPNADKFDSPNIVITLTTYDNAGNETVKTKSIKIDTTNPIADISLADDMKNNIDSTNKFFNHDVKLNITAVDKISGIKSIKYFADATGVNINNIDWSVNGISILSVDKVGTTEEVKNTISIDKSFANSLEAHNLGMINVYVQVIDSADNVSVVSLVNDKKDDTFRIETVKPEISVEYTGIEAAYSTKDDIEYYNNERTAVISVKENGIFFDKNLVKILIVEDDGDVININDRTKSADGVLIGEWTKGTGDDAVHTVTVKFTKNHKYVLNVEAQDLAENKSVGFDINKSKAFVIDSVNPTGEIKYNNLSVGADKKWNSVIDWANLLDGKRYEISCFSKGNLSVSGNVRDEFSGLKEVSYCISSNDGIFADLSGITQWIPLESWGNDGAYSINMPLNDKNYVVYMKLIDYSGNVSYISTNGSVVDTQAPKIGITLPASTNGVYASNVNVQVSVSDTSSSGVVSGIKNVSYKVTSLDQQTQAGDLYTYTSTAGSLNELTKTLSKNFVVDAALNNSNGVLIEVTAVDNAGNTFKLSDLINIDITRPSIEVSYDNNSGDTSFDENVYFKDARTATIKIKERNFDESKVVPVIEASAGELPSISGWTTIDGNGNGDDTLHITTIYFGNDADYTFNISAEDVVGNKSGEVDFGDTLSPTKFVVDKTMPVISVTYDNNNAAETNYFKEQRTATVTIQEHNFESSRVVLTMNATDNGNVVTAPTISGWSDFGDSHTATISFSSDAVYTWSMAYTDKAGNQATNLENQSFCIDLTKPAVTISGINPNSANNTEGKIGFEIECTDTNFGTFTPILTAIIYENGTFISKEIKGSTTSVGNGEKIEYGNLKEDGMYSLTCSAIDKAGNAYDTVCIIDEDGVATNVNLQDGDNLIEFSVNRNGSTFALNDYSMEVVNNYYIQESSQDIVFIETNADELMKYKVNLNGRELEEGTDYTVSESGGNNSWYRYEYIVDKALFIEEGEYNIVVESEDKATSTAYSDIKNVSVDFVIDKTAPTFTISGIEENGNYRGISQSVTLVPNDDGGKLGHVQVNLLDKNGSNVKTVSDLEGDELTEYLNNNDGMIKFEIPEGINQQIEIICADCSIGADGRTNSYDYIYKGITVSSNALILFYENKPLLYGTLGGATVAVLAPGGVIFFRKRKLIKLRK